MNVEAKNSTSKLLPILGLVVLLISSEALYLVLLQLDAINGWKPVLTFWLEMSALFIFYALAAILVKRLVAFKKTAMFLIIFGAVLFRITLLPAGIPFDFTAEEKLAALKTDLQGTEVTYERYQLFDNDIWRYLWDGHVWANGINPYKYSPIDENLDSLAGEMQTEESEFSVDEEAPESDDEAVEDVQTQTPEQNEIPLEEQPQVQNEIWQDIRENVNYSDVTTIYSPLAQFIFRVSHAIAPGSVLMMKILLVLCELTGILFLVLSLKKLELPVASVILYAWNPLMIKVFAGSGHADSILLMMLCATVYFVIRGMKSMTAIAFGFAILAKISPVFLMPLIVRRVGWWRSCLIGVVVFLGYLPFLDAGENLFAGFLKFAREWQFNPGIYAFVRYLGELFVTDATYFARIVCLILITSITFWLVYRDDLSEKTFVKSSAIILGSLIIFSPTVMPWYLSWVLPFAVLARQNVWIYLSALVLVAFHIIIDQSEYAFALWIEHGSFFALVIGTVFLNRQKKEVS
jgi:alpha-1,6-mannosyltransferase